MKKDKTQAFRSESATPKKKLTYIANLHIGKTVCADGGSAVSDSVKTQETEKQSNNNNNVNIHFISIRLLW